MTTASTETPPRTLRQLASDLPPGLCPKAAARILAVPAEIAGWSDDAFLAAASMLEAHADAEVSVVPLMSVMPNDAGSDEQDRYIWAEDVVRCLGVTGRAGRLADAGHGGFGMLYGAEWVDVAADAYIVTRVAPQRYLDTARQRIEPWLLARTSARASQPGDGALATHLSTSWSAGPESLWATLVRLRAGR